MALIQNDDDDNFFDQVVGMADRLKLEGEGRATYIDDHMLQAGYQRVQTRESYARVKEETETEQTGSSRWGFGPKKTAGSSSSGSANDDRF